MRNDCLHSEIRASLRSFRSIESRGEASGRWNTPSEPKFSRKLTVSGIRSKKFLEKIRSSAMTSTNGLPRKSPGYGSTDRMDIGYCDRTFQGVNSQSKGTFHSSQMYFSFIGEHYWIFSSFQGFARNFTFWGTSLLGVNLHRWI
jgi:hypothetical protein